MKRWLSLLLALCMVLSLCSCKKKDDEEPDASGVISTTEPDKVIGDRVDPNGDNPGGDSPIGPEQGDIESVNWKVGDKVSVDNIISESKFPIKTGNVKISVTLTDMVSFVDGDLDVDIYLIDGEVVALGFKAISEDMGMESVLHVVDDAAYVLVDIMYSEPELYTFSATDEDVKELFSLFVEGLDLDSIFESDANGYMIYQGTADGNYVFDLTAAGSSLKVYSDKSSRNVTKFLLSNGENFMDMVFSYGEDAISPVLTSDFGTAEEIDSDYGVYLFASSIQLVASIENLNQGLDTSAPDQNGEDESQRVETDGDTGVGDMSAQSD